MISILIPVYEESCIHLVNDLREQAKKLLEDFEILVFDDCSPTRREDNRPLASMRGVFYHELSANVGRSAIRNLLADRAKGDKLLFVDCDSKVVREDFLEKYLNEADTADVVCGGRIYTPKEETERKYMLNWKCGVERECFKNRVGENAFLSNNFMIKKTVFQSVRFDETIKDYGHEDTLFGLQLKKKGFRITDINNPVIHLHLSDFDSFMSKTCQGVRNLKKLLQTSDCKEELAQLPLVRAYNGLRKCGMSSLYCILFHIAKPFMLRCLAVNNPSLTLFDLYKLGIFCEKDKARS